MAYGAQISNTSGLTRLTVTDFIHRFVQSGIVTNFDPGNPTPIFVPVTGMTISDEWAVLSTYSCLAKLSTGGFYLINGSDSGLTAYYYTVWRR